MVALWYSDLMTLGSVWLSARAQSKSYCRHQRHDIPSVGSFYRSLTVSTSPQPVLPYTADMYLDISLSTY
jgi:hypothetical protein